MPRPSWREDSGDILRGGTHAPYTHRTRHSTHCSLSLCWRQRALGRAVLQVSHVHIRSRGALLKARALGLVQQRLIQPLIELEDEANRNGILARARTHMGWRLQTQGAHTRPCRARTRPCRARTGPCSGRTQGLRRASELASSAPAQCPARCLSPQSFPQRQTLHTAVEAEHGTR